MLTALANRIKQIPFEVVLGTEFVQVLEKDVVQLSTLVATLAFLHFLFFHNMFSLFDAISHLGVVARRGCLLVLNKRQMSFNCLESLLEFFSFQRNRFSVEVNKI